jgi:DNA-binding IclR family transcriptional regulator
VYDQTVINVFHVPGRQPVKLTYTKGLPMPLFRGSQAHVILAHMDRRKLRRIYEAAMEEPAQAADAARIGEDWTAFGKELKRIRAAGHYVSRGELDADVVGIAAPVFGEHQEILGSLVLSMSASTPPPISEEMLVGMVMQCANEITKRIGHEAGTAV